MSSLDKLIRFDRQGVCGPALSLMALSGKYHSKELAVVIKILQENAEKIAHISLRGRKEFIQLAQAGGASLTVVQILSTRFFQGLQAEEPLPPTYPDIKQTIAPKILMEASNCILELQEILAQEETKEALIDWLAKVLSRYKTEQQVDWECLYEQLVAKRPDIGLKYRKYDHQFCEAVKNKEISKNECRAILLDLQDNMYQGGYPDGWEGYISRIYVRAGDEAACERALVYVKQYMDFFLEVGEDFSWFSQYVCDSLVKRFEEIHQSEPLFLPTGLLGPAGIALSLLYQANSLSIEQLTTAAKAVKRTYTVMTGQEIHGRKLFCQMFEAAKHEWREVSWEDMLSSRMFTEMQPEQVDDRLQHQWTMEWLVPYSYERVAQHSPQLIARLPHENEALAETLARLIESFMSSEDLKREGIWKRLSYTIGMETVKKFLAADAAVYKAAWEGKLDEQDLNLLVRSLQTEEDVWELGRCSRGPNLNLVGLQERTAGGAEDKQALLTEVVAMYQMLLGKEWSELKEHTMRMLDIYFRETFFPGSAAISQSS